MDINDLQHGGAAAGFLAACLTVWNMLSGRNERRIREVALVAIRESSEYVRNERQDEINRSLRDDSVWLRKKFEEIDSKLDMLLMGGHLHQRRSDKDGDQ